MSSDNLQLFNKLTEDEKNTVKNIIKEIANTGKSEQLTDLYYEDYEEIPVDLETFLCDEMYLGKYTNYGKDIYDTWKKELAYVHNPLTFCDQWAITRLNAGLVRARYPHIAYVTSYISLCV